MYTLVIRSDLNRNDGRVRVLGFAQREGLRRVGIPVGCSSPTKGPTKTLSLLWAARGDGGVDPRNPRRVLAVDFRTGGGG